MNRITALETELAGLYAARELEIAELVTWERWTLQAVADHYGLTRERIRQIVKRHHASQPVLTETAGERAQRAREAFQLARHAQDLRAERYAMGYAEETKAFYGDESVAQADETEQRLLWRWQDWHQTSEAV